MARELMGAVVEVVEVGQDLSWRSWCQDKSWPTTKKHALEFQPARPVAIAGPLRLGVDRVAGANR